MWRSVTYWLVGKAITNPVYTVGFTILLTTHSGRQLLRIVAGESVRYSYRTGSRIATEMLVPRSISAWLMVRPHLIPVGVPVALTSAAVAGHSLTTALGGTPGAGGQFGVAPSHHLVGGRPWWEADDPQTSAVRYSVRNHPLNPFRHFQ